MFVVRILFCCAIYLLAWSDMCAQSKRLERHKDSNDSLLSIATQLVKEYPDSADRIFEFIISQAHTDSVKLNYFEQYSEILKVAGAYERVNYFVNQALNLNIGSWNQEKYASLLIFKVNYYRLINELDSAIIWGNDLYQYTIDNDLPHQTVSALIELGAVYEVVSDYVRALDYNLEAIEVATKSNHKHALATAYTNTAIVYNRIDQIREAISYNKKGLKLLEELDDKPTYIQICNNISLAYDNLKEYDSARIYLLKGLEVARKTNHQFGIAVTTLNLGLNAYRLNEFQEALRLFREVELFFHNINDRYGITLCHYNFCRIYFDSGDLEKALEYGLAGHEFATTNGYINELGDISQYLSLIYEKKGDFDQALKYFKEHSAIMDSTFNKDKSKEIGRMESRFELNQAIHQNEVLTKDREIQEQKLKTTRLWSIGLVILVAIILAFLVYYYRTNKRLDHFNRMVEKQSARLQELDMYKSRFFANISHDLRTPISLIQGYFQELQQDGDIYLTQKAEDSIKKGIKNVDRLIRLTDEIQDLIRLEEGNFKLVYKKVKIVPYLSLLVELFRSQAESKGLELVFESGIDPSALMALDPDQFEKIQYNLISNAIKFTKEGQIAVYLSGNDETVEIKIVDTGKGIPPNQVNNIFDRFYQLPDDDYYVRQGMGIGLFLVKELIELHDGKVTVESKVGQGTSISLTLPRKIEMDAEVYEPTVSSIVSNAEHDILVDVPLHTEKLNSDRSTILVVDDHPEIRDYIGNQLKDNYNLIYAANGVQALKSLKKMSINLVITDLMMPVMDGFELLKKIKLDHANVPALVVSARTSLKDTTEVLGYGINDFISKPFSKEDFQLRVKNLINSRNPQRGLPLVENDHVKLANNNALSKINTLIEKHMTNSKLGIPLLADELCLSERQTNRFIKSLTGNSPGEYVKNYKLQFAKDLLDRKEIRTASELARMTGFSNVTYFNEAFEKKYGYRPLR